MTIPRLTPGQYTTPAANPKLTLVESGKELSMNDLLPSDKNAADALANSLRNNANPQRASNASSAGSFSSNPQRASNASSTGSFFGSGTFVGGTQLLQQSAEG